MWGLLSTMKLLLSILIFLLGFSGVMMKINAQVDRNSKIGFKLKSWKKLLESNFKEGKYKKASINFCISNFEKYRSRVFNLQSNLNYFTPKCKSKHEDIFYGFSAAGLLVEVVECKFYVHDRRWTLVELYEDSDAIIEPRQFSLFSYQDERTQNILRWNESHIDI